MLLIESHNLDDGRFAIEYSRAYISVKLRSGQLSQQQLDRLNHSVATEVEQLQLDFLLTLSALKTASVSDAIAAANTFVANATELAPLFASTVLREQALLNLRQQDYAAGTNTCKR